MNQGNHSNTTAQAGRQGTTEESEMDYPYSHRHVDEAILGRRSIRAFLDRPVAREVVEDILEIAARAPSGSNAQPWQVIALAGEPKIELSRRVLAAYDDPVAAAGHKPEYDYYPREWTSPYLERRRKVGWDLYTLLGIAKGDKARMHAQHGRNFRFFDAPVGLIFTIDRIMCQGSWLDYGMFLQNLMIAARARGLDTCPQAAFARFHRIIGEYLSIPPERMLIGGMSLGYADPQALENSLVSEREPVRGFARFEGW